MLKYLFAQAYRTTSPYGERTNPITGEVQFHNGTDYATPIGTSVLSPVNGVVAFSSNDDRSGAYIGVKGEGYTISFSHLLSPTKFAGDPVQKGEVIAISGNSGSSTGPHTHIVVKDEKGETVNPETVLPTSPQNNTDDAVLYAAAAAAGILAIW